MCQMKGKIQQGKHRNIQWYHTSNKTWCECSGSINSPLMILQILCPGPADSIMMFSNTVMYNVQCKCMHIVWCDVLTVYHWHTIHKSHSVNQEIDIHSILPRHKTLTNNFLTKPMTEWYKYKICLSYKCSHD